MITVGVRPPGVAALAGRGAMSGEWASGSGDGASGEWGSDGGRPVENARLEDDDDRGDGPFGLPFEMVVFVIILITAVCILLSVFIIMRMRRPEGADKSLGAGSAPARALAPHRRRRPRRGFFNLRRSEAVEPAPEPRPEPEHAADDASDAPEYDADVAHAPPAAPPAAFVAQPHRCAPPLPPQGSGATVGAGRALPGAPPPPAPAGAARFSVQPAALANYFDAQAVHRDF